MRKLAVLCASIAFIGLTGCQKNNHTTRIDSFVINCISAADPVNDKPDVIQACTESAMIIYTTVERGENGRS